MRMWLLAIVGVLFLVACPSTGGEDGGASDAGGSDRATSHDAAGRDMVAVDRTGTDATENDATVACTPDDSQEENDEATAAKAITVPGTTSDLVGCDDDWFSFTAQANQAVEVKIEFDGTAADLDMDLYLASDPTTSISSSSGVGNTEIVSSYFAAATPVLVNVEKYSGGRVTYTLTVTFLSPPANNTCANAVAITPGTPISATTLHSANDYQFVSAGTSCTGYGTPGPDVTYTISIPAGQYLTAWLYSASDLSMYLVDDCTNLCCWDGADHEGGGGDPEVLVYQNGSGSAQNLYLIVDSWRETTASDFGLSVALGASPSPDAGVEDGGSAVTNCIPNTAVDAGSEDI